MPPDHPAEVSSGDVGRIFAFLSTEQQQRLKGRLRLQSISAGETLFRGGDRAESIYFLLTGQLAVKKGTGFGQNEQVIALLSSPAPVGEGVVIGQDHRRASVIAVSDATMLSIDQTELTRLLADHPDIFQSLLCRLMTVIGLRLDQCSARLARIL